MEGSMDLEQDLIRLRSDRKRRLFACACLRDAWHLLTDERSRKAVETAERFADGLATGEELRAAGDAACATGSAATDASKGGAEWCVAHATANALDHTTRSAADPYFAANAAACVLASAAPSTSWDDAYEAAALQQFPLLDDLAGPANRSDVPRTQFVMNLAQVIYDQRRWQDLPVLADALEEVGCTDATVLAHLRGPGPHAKGCWALDLILNKE
jgi:hypothetical protein